MGHTLRYLPNIPDTYLRTLNRQTHVVRIIQKMEQSNGGLGLKNDVIAELNL